MATAPIARQQFGWFHITNLGVDHVDIFDTPLDHLVFEYEIQVAAGLFEIEIHAYCWMGNHFHLIVNCPDGNLSRFMQRFEAQYVLKHNRAIGRRGPLFISRFGAFPIGVNDHDPEDGAAVVSRYVHRNPLDIVPIAELAAYPHSSYGVYLGLAPAPTWMQTDVLTSVFEAMSSSLRDFTERSHPTDRTPLAGRRHRPFGIDDVLAAVAATTGVSISELSVAQAGEVQLARLLAAALVARLRPFSEVELTEVFGVGGRRSVQRLTAKGKALLASDVEFGDAADRAMSILWQEPSSLRRAA